MESYSTPKAIAVFDAKSSFNKANISGEVTFTQYSYFTEVVFNLSGFQPHKTHAVHIHRYGDLTKGCASTCDHYNPFGNMHGSIALFGPERHVGDLCNNITSDSSGKVLFAYRDNLVRVQGPTSILGRSVVIHEREDDLGRYRYENTKRGQDSRTTGNAGARIACAVIGVMLSSSQAGTSFC